MNTIKIFLASSLELKEERVAFEIFCRRLNSRLIEEGLYLNLIIWEDFIDSISQTRKQDDYNKEILKCDIFISLYFSKVGKYTEEEFDIAYNSFMKGGKPKFIYVYFKNANIQSNAIDDSITSLLNFKKRIHELGHFYNEFNNQDELLLHFKNQFEKLKKKLISYGNPDEPDIPFNDKLKDRYFRNMYHFNGAYANALRIVGAADDFFSSTDLLVKWTDEKYELIDEFDARYEKIVNRKKKEAKENGAMFFDGLNSRLCSYYVSPIDGTEKKKLEIEFGPIGWYDYTVVNEIFSRVLSKKDLKEIFEFINLDEVANSGILTKSKLTNIIETATTLITVDKKILYTRRGARVSAHANYYTSCIAENIHPEFDGLTEQNGNENPIFRTVIRGIKEELSPSLLTYIDQSHLKLLGMSFDLDVFHPNLLFIIVIPLEYKEIEKICLNNPGKDFVEGQMLACEMENLNEISKILSYKNWVPSGKASFMRSLEFLSNVNQLKDYSYLEFLKITNTII